MKFAGIVEAFGDVWLSVGKFCELCVGKFFCREGACHVAVFYG